MIRTSIIVPAYNEERTIQQILTQVRSQRVEGVEFEIVVVNDGSKDRTAEILNANPRLYDKFVDLKKNGGKGAAVRAALTQATGEYVLFQDADLEYDPQEYVKLMMPAMRFNADVVIGSRFLASPYSRVVYFWHKVGNRVITFLFNILNNTTFTDTYSCYLMYRRKLIQPSELKTSGWQQQAEILGLAVSRGKIFYEVPISYNGRTYEEGKKIRARHIVKVVLAMIETRFLRK